MTSTSPMTLAWMYLGAARGALRAGNRAAAVRFLSRAAASRRRALAVCDVVIGDGRTVRSTTPGIRHVPPRAIGIQL